MMTEALFAVGADDVADTSNDCYTPPWIFDAAGLMFDLDVCAPVAPEFRTCPARRYLTVLDDGLTAPWDGLIWMNPPYNNSAPWVDRFIIHPAGLVLIQPVNSSWLKRLLPALDGVALVSVRHDSREGQVRGFGRPDGSRALWRHPLILGARGELALSALARVAEADAYAGGAWFVRP